MTQSEVEALIERELPHMPGWCTPQKGKRMAELTRNSKLCVELGVFGGRSLVSIACALAAQGFGRVDGVDPFTPAAALEGTNDPQNAEWWDHLDFEAVARVAQESLYRFKLMPYARLVRMHSLDVVNFYEDGSVDLLHQDSNHAHEISGEEVLRWAPKIRPGGYWIADDTNWQSTQRAQHELETLGFVELEDHESWKVYMNGAVR